MRNTLASGHDLEHARQQSQQLLQSVGRQLREQGISADHLTAPTRRAYLYLRNLDFDAAARQLASNGNAAAQDSDDASTAPAGSPGQADQADQPDQARPPRLRFPGLQRRLNELAIVLSDADDDALSNIGGHITTYSNGLEQAIANDRIEPSQLSAQARAARAWFAWLSQPDRLRQYHQSMRCMQQQLTAASTHAGLRWRQFTVRFVPLSGSYRLSGREGHLDLRLNIALLTLPEDQLQHLATRILRLNNDKKSLFTAMQTPAYQAVLAELDALGGRVDRSRGQVHDLSVAFERVNQRFFAGTMDSPQISWSGRISYRKLGHYAPLQDAIEISSALDSPAVPQAALDFVLFHELLHKQHGTEWHGNRAHSHTPAFRRDERRYPDKDNIEALLARLAD